MDQQQLIDLRHQLLHDFEHGRSWENPTTSFFDQARLRTPDVITLQEHFRCVPEIIGFSNRIAYEPDKVPLIPLRQYGRERLEPIRSVYVRDGYTMGEGNRKVNEPEVDAVVDAVLTCCADARYDGKTMGVISLTGSGQADRIEQELLARMDPTDYKRRNLRCGISPDFQGSERDVVFLSMVAAPSADRRLTALTARSYMQRFNVAASRARDQMWLVHSVTLDELTNREDMRYQLLEYCATVQRRDDDNNDPFGLVPQDVLVDPFDSLFEQHIYNKLYERGYTVVPQWEVYNYRIDLVVVGGGARLAVECDGDRYHGADRFEEDLRRQRELERCGWTFERVRASNFYRDPHAALEPVWERLAELDIRPLVHDEPQPAPEPQPATRRPSAGDGSPSSPVESVAYGREADLENVRPTLDSVPSPPRVATEADSWATPTRQPELVGIREADPADRAGSPPATDDAFLAEQRGELKRLYEVFDEKVRTMDGVASSVADQQALVHAKNARSSIERALTRIETSSYGRCVACGTAIGRGRLIARPYAERCVDCA